MRINVTQAVTVKGKLVVLGVDTHGRIWVNPDALGDGAWRRMSTRTVATETE